ncbi:HAMP domain-containing histidine kinase [Candidatus Microgenomates bacterium]|nr:HAMP domain-containing histidine kinase [Candidatus Microgenomates bacterium]
MAHAKPRQTKSLKLAPFDLVATTAHELKSPLVLIKGLASMLAEGQFGKINQRQARYVARIGQACERLLRLTESLITINRSQHQRLVPRQEPIAITRLITHIISELQPRIAKQHMTIVWSPFLKVPPVLADPDYVHQVFFNLFDNALKFSPIKSTITVKLRRGDNHLAVQISDQGVGVKPSDMKYLFERFGQSGQPVQAHAGSSGLGLFIVKSLVELQGGAVSAQSLRQGTCFTVKLPIAQQLELFTSQKP